MDECKARGRKKRGGTTGSTAANGDVMEFTLLAQQGLADDYTNCIATPKPPPLRCPRRKG
jgi:hypothetical protein